MGQDESTLNHTSGFPSDEHLAECDTLGYRVLGVQPDSPASNAGLVSFLDFLVGCDGRMLLSNDDEEEDIDFVETLKNSVGEELELLVFNIKSQQTRFVSLIPKNDWGGSGLLGVTIRLDDYGGADERLIRVLGVENNSPAEISGLIELKDYLLGTSTISFSSTAVLSDVLVQHEDKTIELYVYNIESDIVRVVTLMPTACWGGNGLLGAEVGVGYLHKLPSSCRGTDGSSVKVRINTTLKKMPNLPVLTVEKNLCHDAGILSVASLNHGNTSLEEIEKENRIPSDIPDHNNDDKVHKSTSKVKIVIEPKVLGNPSIINEEKDEYCAKLTISSPPPARCVMDESSTVGAVHEERSMTTIETNEDDFTRLNDSIVESLEGEDGIVSSKSEEIVPKEIEHKKLQSLPAIIDSNAGDENVTENVKVVKSPADLMNLPPLPKFPSIPFRAGSLTPPTSVNADAGSKFSDQHAPISFLPPPPMSNLMISGSSSPMASHNATDLQ